MKHINHNGVIRAENADLSVEANRGFAYGDALFDVLKYDGVGIGFLEDHYFRLMSSMRMLRMKIPSRFTLEVYEKEIMKTIHAHEMEGPARIRVSVFRKRGGDYFPETNQSEYFIEAQPLNDENSGEYEIELFKDYHVSSGLLSTVKTNNRMVNVLGAVFAQENDYQNVILINERKELVGATDANLFLVKDGRLLTPALESGCINGIIRKKIVEKAAAMADLEVEQTSISPFELLKVDEVFFTNSTRGVQSVDKYRKKVYGKSVADQIESKLKVLGRIS